MAQMLSRRPVMARVRSQVSTFEISVGQSGTGPGFSPSTWVLLCNSDSTNAPYSSLFTFWSYQKDKQALTGNLPKIMAAYEIWEHFVEK
jgi:hypothetical protein